MRSRGWLSALLVVAAGFVPTVVAMSPAHAAASTTFGAPIELPLPPADDQGFQTDEVASISCWSPGNCSTIGVGQSEQEGTAGNANSPIEANSELDGVWQDAVTLATPLETWVGASVDDIACPAAGDCIAVGSFQYISDASSQTEVPVTTPMIVVESGGEWSSPQQLGSVPANDTTLASVSCANADSCIATGWTNPDRQGGTPVYSTGTDATLTAPIDGGPGGPVACPPSSDSAVQCWGASAVLTKDDSGDQIATVSAQPESAGTWGSPDTIYVNDEGPYGESVTAGAITCPVLDECTMAGVTEADDGTVAASQDAVYVIAQNNSGVWGSAQGISDPPNTALPQSDDSGYVTIGGIGCADTSSCVVDGDYGTTGPNNQNSIQPWAALGSAGQWSQGMQVPQPSDASSTAVYGYGTGVGCYAGGCTIAGNYLGSYYLHPGFADNVSLTASGGGPDPSQTAVGCEPASSPGTFTCTATVASPSATDGAPTGTVTFGSSTGSVDSSPCPLVEATLTTATCSITVTPTATQNAHDLTVSAVYPDTGNLAGSSDSTVIPAVSINVSAKAVRTYLSGTADAAFDVALSRASDLPTSFAYRTADGSGTHGAKASAGDYTKTDGTATLASGAIRDTISVRCSPTVTMRDAGSLDLLSSDPSGAVLRTPSSTATIDPDLVAGTVHSIGFIGHGNGKPKVYLKRYGTSSLTKLHDGEKVEVGDELYTAKGGAMSIEFLIAGKVKAVAAQHASSTSHDSTTRSGTVTTHLIAHTLHLAERVNKHNEKLEIKTAGGILSST